MPDPGFDPIIEEFKARREQAERVKQSAAYGAGFDPAQQAKVQSAARKLGVEPEAVLDPQADLLQREIDSFDYSSFVRKSPKSAAFVADPRTSEVVRPAEFGVFAKLEAMHADAAGLGAAEASRIQRNKDKDFALAMLAPALKGLFVGLVGRPAQAAIELGESAVVGAYKSGRDALLGVEKGSRFDSLRNFMVGEGAVDDNALSAADKAFGGSLLWDFAKASVPAIDSGVARGRVAQNRATTQFAGPASEWFTKNLDSLEELYQSGSFEASDSYNPIKNPAFYYNMAAENAPQLILQRYAAMGSYGNAISRGVSHEAALKTATLISASSEGVQIFGDSYDTARKKGLAPGEAAAIATAITIPSMFVSSGLPGMDGLVGKLESQGIKSGFKYKMAELAEQGLEGMFLNKATRSWAEATGATGVLKRTAMGIFKEGAEETAQEEIAMAGESTYDPNAYANAGKRRLDSFLGGALLGGLGGAAHGRVASPFVKQREFLEALADAGKRAEFAKHAPEKLGQFVHELTVGGDLKNMHHSAEGWVTFWQQKGLTAEQAKVKALELGVTSADYDTALAGGSDLVLPTANLAERMTGKEEFAELIPNLKPKQSGMTFAEMETARLDQMLVEQERKLIQEIITENPQHAERAQVKEAIAAEMRAAKALRGDTAAIDEVAASYAMVVTGLANRSGKYTPMQLFEAERVTFMRGVNKTVQEMDNSFPMAAQRKRVMAAMGRIRGKMAKGVQDGTVRRAATSSGKVSPLNQSRSQATPGSEPGVEGGVGLAEEGGATGGLATEKLAAARAERLADFTEGRVGLRPLLAHHRTLRLNDDPAALVAVSTGLMDHKFPWAPPVEGVTLGGNAFVLDAGVLHITLPNGLGELHITLVPAQGILNVDSIYLSDSAREKGLAKDLLQDAAQLALAAYPELRVMTGELTTAEAKVVRESYPGSRFSADGITVATPIAEVAERASTIEQKLANSFKLAGIDIEGLTDDQALDELEAWMRENGKLFAPLSSRVPTAKGAKPAAGILLSGYEAINEDPKLLSKLVGLVSKYDGVSLSGTDQEKAEQFIAHVEENLLWLFNEMPSELRDRAKLWYEGANKIAQRWASENNKTLAQMAGVLAVMSPQRDWFANVSLAERVIDFHLNHRTMAWDEKFEAAAQKMMAAERAELLTKQKDAFKKKHGISFFDATKKAKAEGKKKLPKLEPKELGPTGFTALYSQVKGKGFQELTDKRQQAFFIRLYDYTYNPSSFNVITPEGEITTPKTKAGGAESGIQWGSLDTVVKAMDVLATEDEQVLSDALGAAHKVRNFYNNIYDPNSPDFVTIDTHAVAAGLVLPLGGSAQEVVDSLTGPSSNMTGASGTYGLYQEAYIRAAQKVGVLPREMQSITWEAVRGLFRPEDKRNKGGVAEVRKVWKRVTAGDITASQARTEIATMLGGFKTPDWAEPTEQEMLNELNEPTTAGSVNVESMPGSSIRSSIFPNLGMATTEQLDEYHRAKMQVVLDTLTAAGVQVDMESLGHGYWEGETNLVTSFKIMLSSPELLTKAAQIVADTVGDQDAIGINHPVFETDQKQHNAVLAVLSRNLTAQEMVAVGKALESVPNAFVDASNPAQLKHISYDFTYTETYHSDVLELIKSVLPADVIIDEQASGSYRAHSNLVKRSQNDSEAAAAGSSDLQGAAVARGRQAIHNLNAEYGAKFGWGPGRSAHSRHGVHYSKTAGLNELDSNYYGKGSPGAERRRLAGAPPELRQRIHLYASADGLLPTPERVVAGRVPYETVVDNLYDIAEDPDGLWQNGGADANMRESGLLAAGYSGYWSPEPGDHGSIVLLGPRKLKVDPLGQPDSFTKTITLEELRELRGSDGSVPGPVRLEQPASTKAVDPNSPEFKAWFGASKAVWEDGTPRVYYHGTTAEFDSFKAKGAATGDAIFFSTDPGPDGAGGYNKAGGGRTIPVFLKIEKPFDFSSDKDMADYAEYLGLTDDRIKWWQGDPEAEAYRAAYVGAWDFMESAEFQKFLDTKGYDSFYTIENGTRHIGVRSSTQIKSAISNTGDFDPNSPVIFYQPASTKAVDPNSPEFKAWFGDSKVVDKSGAPLVVYHGTTAEFDEFDRSRANIESDQGAGFYFTNNTEDLGANYAGEGPDLTQKIDLTAERIAAETGREYNDPDVVAEARSKFLQHGGAALPVYLSIKNPVLIGGKTETFLEYGFDDETEMETGSLLDFLEAVASEAREFDSTEDGAFGAIFERAMDDGGIKVSEVIQILKDDGGLLYATDDAGNLASTEIIRRAFTAVGFDGIIDSSVNQKFGSERKVGQQMKGVGKGTVHYIAFESTQIKSAISNTGDFDHNNPVIFQQPAQDEARGYLEFDPAQRGGEKRRFNLGLMKSENRSTVFHEFGHLYLEMMGDLAELPSADHTLVEDYKKILKWFGVESRDQITRQMHENFADGYLKYLEAGKTTNPELRQSFRKFSGWLKKIWNTITADMVENGTATVEISDEIRGVFDRLHMGGVAVEQAESELDLQSFDAESLGMSEAEFKQYAEKRKELVEQTRERLVSDMMKELEREKTEAWQAELAEREEAALARLAQDPGYQAMAQILAGQLADGTELDAKLSRVMIEARYGKEVVSKMNRALFAEGGLDSDAAAILLGFESGDALVSSLVDKPLIEDAAAAQAKEAMVLTHGDLSHDQGQLMAEAVELLNGQGMEDLILTELEGIDRKRQQGKANREAGRQAYVVRIQAIKAAAVAHIQGSVTYQVSPHQYLQAQRKANKKAFEAVKAGDLETAHKLKEQELLNHHLYMEALKAVEFGKKFQSSVRKNDKSKVRAIMARAGGGFLAQYDALRDRFSIMRLPNKTLAREQSLKAWVEERQAQGEETSVSALLMDETREFNYRELTVEMLHELDNALRNIKHLAYEQVSTIINGKRVFYDGIMEELQASAEANLSKKPVWRSGSPKRDKLWFKVTAALSGLDASMVKVQQLVNWIDGNNVEGPAHRYIWNPIKAAQAAEAELQLVFTKKIGDIFAALPKEVRTNLDEELTLPGWAEPLSRRELITIALYWGQDERRLKMLGGFAGQGVSQQMVEAALTNLTTAEAQFVNDAWKTLNELWPHISELEKRTKGVEPKRQVDTPFTIVNKNGETLNFTGGYFPYTPDRNVNGKLAKITEGGTVQQILSSNGYGRATTPTGHTKELGKKTYLPDLEFDYIIGTHLANVIKDLTHREAVVSINRIFKREDFQALMKERLGEEYEAQLEPWLVNILGGDNAGASQGLRWWNSLLRKSRAHTSTALLGYNLLSGLVQITDAPRLMAPGDYRVSVWRFHRALGQLIAHPIETFEMVSNLSSEMKHRFNNLDRDQRTIVNNLKKKHSVAASFQLQAFWLFGIMDRITSTSGWLASYQQSMAKHGDEARAISEADRTISMRLMTGAPKDTPAILRKTGGEWLQLVTMFMGDATANYNMLRNAGHNIQGFKGIPTMTGIAATIALTQILAASIKGDGPDEEEELWQWIARKAMLAPLSTVPVGRDIGNSVEDILKGKPIRDFRVTPALMPVQKLLQATDKIVDYTREDSSAEFSDVAIAVFDAIGSMSGLAGTRQIITSGKYFKRYLDGEEDDASKAEFAWRMAAGKKKENK